MNRPKEQIKAEMARMAAADDLANAALLVYGAIKATEVRQPRIVLAGLPALEIIGGNRMLVPPAVNPHAKEPVGTAEYLAERRDSCRRVRVRASSWFEARKLAMAELGTDEINVKRMGAK